MGLLGCASAKSIQVADEAALQGTKPPGTRRTVVRSVLRRRSEKVAPAAPVVKQRTLMVIGCDGAGKTTLLHAMCGKPHADPTATGGFDATLKCVLMGTPLHFYDVGGGKQIRAIWKSYYADVHAAIFVVDAADPSRFDEVRLRTQSPCS